MYCVFGCVCVCVCAVRPTTDAMNSTTTLDDFIKNFVSCFLGVLINTINGFFVYIFFRNATFQRDPRYILYIHLVLNDSLMLTIAVFLQVSMESL